MAAFWICLCAFLSCTGWILSALHSLNQTGYLVAITLGVVIACAWRFRAGLGFFPRVNFRKLLRRFRRPLPLAFLILSSLAFLGGLLHPPSNYDGLAYRVPRVMHWLAEGQWHWINTIFHRLNVRACGMEWVSAPLILFTKSERWLFLINTTGFALLPGLVFSVLRRIKASRRVAWQWMWLLPTGYSYLLQAGSIGNDMYGAVFALAAVDFALRARNSGKISDAWLSIVAVALLTGSKASNLPLGLPWVVAIAPAWRMVLSRPLALAGISAVALLCSFAPMAGLNWRHSGEWSGTALEGLGTVVPSRSVLLGNNSVLLLVQNFCPPVFPAANAWNQAVKRLMPPRMEAVLQQHFEPAGIHWTLGELQIEEAAGLGFGVSVALAALVFLALVRKRKIPCRVNSWRHPAVFISGAAAVALFVFMISSGLSAIGRLATPYYALVIVGVLVWCGDVALEFQRAARVITGAIIFFAASLLILSPARPLWPARTILGALSAEQSANPLLRRAVKVYAVQGRRAESFAPVLAVLPPDATKLGFVSFDDPEAALWRPFGSRRIFHITPRDSTVDLQHSEIRYVLINSQTFKNYFPQPLDAWLEQMDAEMVRQISLELRGSAPPIEWLLIRRRDPTVAPAVTPKL